ncbi:unnamed protein product [Brachionus calyciflorus]|uniref:FMP27/BLTP2/Hobbit GFWDK motif-containing RBG unit domain-containing protein n=1 Tax=Brachionus calyciflorus TaxID=104777 RepID=A0A813YTB4_9BILA|nr:unnamed protein product [Brachionus calyciflorus]
MDVLFISFLLITVWCLVKLILWLISIKYKLNINFKFNRNHLKNFTITKKDSLDSSYNFIFGKIWLSSCFVNRNVNERFLICSSNISINLNKNNKSQSEFKIPWLFSFYLTYIGGINLENLKVNLSSDFKIEIKQLKIHLKNKQILRFSLDELNLSIYENDVVVNRLTLDTALNDFKSLELESDKINLSIKDLKLLDKLKTIKSNGSKNHFKLNALKSVLVNKLTINNRHVLNHLELYNTNLDYLRLSLNSLNDLLLSKSNRLIDNLVIEIFNNKASMEHFYDLVLKCEQSSIYIHIDELKKAICKIRENYKSKGSSVSRKFRLEFKLNNFYLNLINSGQNEIYALGASFINLNTNLKNLLKFETDNFVLFKSNQKNTPNDKYSNNLFSQTNDLRKLFQSINYKKFKYSVSKKQYEHVWGNIINCNFFKFKLRNEPRRKFLSFFIDQIFYEHCPTLLDYLITLISNQKSSKSQNEKKIFFLNFKLNEANLIHLFEKKYFLNFYLENLSLKKYDTLDFNLKSFNCVQNHISHLVKSQSQYLFNQSIIERFKEDNNLNLVFLLKSVSLSKKNSNDYYLTLNDVLITWSLKSHFILNEILFKPIKKYRNLFKKTNDTLVSNFSLKILIQTNILFNMLFDYSQDSSKKEFLEPPKTQSYKYFNSNFKLVDSLSFFLNNFYFAYTRDNFNLSLNEITVFTNTDDYSLLDNDLKKRKFIHIYKLNIFTDEKSDYLLNERTILGTRIVKNKILFSNFDLIYVNFLFSYDFAKLIDHVLNLRKCLYKIHEIPAKKILLNPEDGLSPDFFLNLKQLKLVIEDDPFEVKLSYNYSLICDEYLESIKRRQSLEQRRSIRENNLENQALEILLERESKIYIQRSKLIYSSAPRIELFCVVSENLQLKALCDLDWHGRQKCYDILRNIDSFSPPPPKLNSEGENFNPAENYLILWCRQINLNIQDFKLIFRDYPQPLLKMHSINFYGKFLGSEYAVPWRAKRQVKISISKNLQELDYCNFLIERNMSPFKFYYDLSCKMTSFNYAYGPCWEGCMAQLNLSLEKIIHPARDPSKPMPWWDKSRLYFHGRMSILMQQCQIIYHVSMDPYNRTEEMKLVWTPLMFDWKNMEMSFDGGLDIFLNTESKYDDCCLLHLPNLKAKIKIDWLCKAQVYNKSSELREYNIANSHNLVILCAPDKVPLVINSLEHDSYSQFRSENLNLSFSFICKLENNSNNNDTPTCKFYASTSRFLEKIKNLLSAITRPTKRGKLFQNVRPRKALLSRHFKFVNFKFDLPKINVIYWSSASEQYGIQLESDDFLMNSSLKLDLAPVLDKLKRRPKPNWSVELMKFSVQYTKIYLMSPSTHGSNTPSNEKFQQNSNESDPFMLEMNERSIKFLDSKPAMRNFFMKIDSISYEREKLCQYNFYPETNFNLNLTSLTNASMSSLVPVQITNQPKHNLLIKNLKLKWNTVNRDVVFILYEIYNKSKRLRHNLSAHTLKQYDLFTDQLIQNHLVSQYKNHQRLSSKTSDTKQNLSANKNNQKFENYFEELLNKLDSEKNLNSNIFCDDKTSTQTNSNFNNLIYGLNAINKMADILSENVSIELINSQIKLSLDDLSPTADTFLSFMQKPKKTQNNEKQNDYVIISAARAHVVQHVHKPVWKSQRYLEKISWSGHLENMQYFAALNKNTLNSEYWLNDDLIDPPKDLPACFVIDIDNNSNQLQLIVSKCKCEFYLIGFYDKIPDDNFSNSIQTSASTFNLSNLLTKENSKSNENNQYFLDLNSSFNEPIDCFTLIHHDINLACNSAQYKLFMEIVNNLVLYFRPRRKKIIDRQKSIKFNLQLSMGNLDSLKQYIQLKQIETKQLLCNLRLLEKQIFYLKEKIENEINEFNAKYGGLSSQNNHIYVIQELKLENKNMEKQYRECKKMLSELSDELNILISCYKEMMVEKRAYNLAQTPMFVQYVLENEKINPWLILPSSKKYSDIVDLDQLAQKSILNSEIPKRYEIWFKNTKWKLNDDDGRSGLAKFLMKNFLYTKVTNQQELDCVEHNLEIEFCKLQDLVPLKNKQNKFYEDVLTSLFDSSQIDHEGLHENDDNSQSSSTSASISQSVSNSSSISSISLANNNNNSNNNEINMSINHHNSTMIRILCKERPPVGIPVIEHLELNVSPLMINLTNRFFKMMIKYFFESQPNDEFFNSEEQLSIKQNMNSASSNNANLLNSTSSPFNQIKSNSNQNNNLITKVQSPSGLKNFLGHHKRPSQSSLKGNNLVIASPSLVLPVSNNTVNNTQSLSSNEANARNNHLQIEDVEIMKQRSANNNTFLCIKIPEIQLLVSYKSSNVDKKNIKDLNNVSLIFPLFEVHDKTWTWLDLINALKSHVKKALLSQAIKHKLMKIPIQPVNKLINRNRRSNSQQQLTDSQIEEHEKMTLLKLFGTKFIEKKSLTPNIGHSSKETENENNAKSNKMALNETSPITTKKKGLLAKSKSTVGFGFKKNLLKLNKDKVESNDQDDVDSHENYVHVNNDLVDS